MVTAKPYVDNNMLYKLSLSPLAQGAIDYSLGISHAVPVVDPHDIAHCEVNVIHANVDIN